MISSNSCDMDLYFLGICRDCRFLRMRRKVTLDQPVVSLTYYYCDRLMRTASGTMKCTSFQEVCTTE